MSLTFRGQPTNYKIEEMYFCKNNFLNSEDGMEISFEELPFEF